MKVIKRKDLRDVRDEKNIVPELEQAITDLEIENLLKDQTINDLQDVITEDEQAITDLEIKVAELEKNHTTEG